MPKDTVVSWLLRHKLQLLCLALKDSTPRRAMPHRCTIVQQKRKVRSTRHYPLSQANAKRLTIWSYSRTSWIKVMAHIKTWWQHPPNHLSSVQAYRHLQHQQIMICSVEIPPSQAWPRSVSLKNDSICHIQRLKWQKSSLLQSKWKSRTTCWVKQKRRNLPKSIPSIDTRPTLRKNK